MFAHIGMGGEIRNVELIDVDVTGEDYVGALAGGNTGLVEDTYATGEVDADGDAVGGLIGINEGTITGSYFDGTVTSVEGNANGDFTGGLVGISYENGTISGCYTIATVTSEVGNCTGGLIGANNGSINDSHAICSVTGNEAVGGLVGENSSNGSIDNSYADGDVTGDVRVGGLIGFNDFTITDSYFTGEVTATGDYTGGLAGESSDSIQGCHADATVTSAGDYVGGLAGLSRGATTSYATGTVTGGSYVGGLIGESYRSSGSDVIDASYSTSAVTGESYIGGLVGSNEIDISASYAKGSVTGVEEDSIGCEYAGGLIGNNTAPIRNSYAWGDVSGYEYVGGLVGYNEGPDATIVKCYEIGAVDGNDGNYVGPLIGRVNLLGDEDIVGSFWNNNTSGHVSSDWGINVGTVSMKQQVTYINEYWNFDTTWGINTVDNDGYPFLRWQNAAEFAGGSGTEGDPYLVATADHLNNVRNHFDQHFKQIENVDLSFYRSGSGWVPIGSSSAPFTGTYDGNGYTIGNLFIDQVGAWNVRNPAGLFGYTGTEAAISNLTLEDVDITGCYYVGSLVGNNGGEILDVSISGSVTGEWDTGGLAGLNSGSITGSAFTGTVTGADEIEYGDWTGGLVGYNIGGTITKCQTYVTVVSEGDSVGGLAGDSLNDAVITESCAMGSVSASSYIGGLVGTNDGEITECYSTCSVYGNSDIGGLVGGNSGLIGDCYAVGAVDGTNRIGGLAVNSSEEDITNCYWDTETTGQSDSAGGTGMATAEMKQQATFENWDFLTIWDMNADDNNGYPFLRWQLNVPPVLSGTGVDSITDTTAALSFTSDRNGIYYYLVYTATEDAPDAAAIKTQGTAAAKGTGTAAAAANTVGLAGLTASTEYTAYIILEYIEENTSGVAAINFTTEAVPAEFAGGNGSAENPFLVADANELNNVRNHLDKHFVQTQDIDLSGYSAGEGWLPIGDNNDPFAGTYDGDGFSIDNLFIERDDDYSGLFGYIDVNGNVSDLELNSVDVTSSAYYVGSLAGSSNGQISNCSVAGTVALNGWGLRIGGLTGENENYGTITNCSFDGIVESDDDYCGGLVGWDEGTIINCHTTGTVRGDDEVGGLVGYKVSGVIRESYSECAVEAVNSNSTQTGGLVGNNDGEIDRCYASGTVTGNEDVGGLVGFNYRPVGIIVNCYATSSVNGNDYVGGLAGGNSNSITDCYSTGAVTAPAGSANTGGLAGYNSATGIVTDSFWNTETSGQNTSAGGAGKTTAQMKQQETFTDWDFTTIWGINNSDNGGYPFLRWQGYVHGDPVIGVCRIGDTGYATFDAALATLADNTPTTIVLLQDITDGDGLSLSRKDLTIDLNGKNFTVNNNTGVGISMSLCSSLNFTGPGSLTVQSDMAGLDLTQSHFTAAGNVDVDIESENNWGLLTDTECTVSFAGEVRGARGGISASGSDNQIAVAGTVTSTGSYSENHAIRISQYNNTVQVGSAIVAAGNGAGVYVDTFAGGTVTVGSSETSGQVVGKGNGLWIRSDAKVTVYGDIEGAVRGIYTVEDSTVTVHGNVTSSAATGEGQGIYCFANSTPATITVNGNVEGISGAYVHGGGSILTINGNVAARGADPASNYGVYASYAEVNVTGNLTASQCLGAHSFESSEIQVEGVLSAFNYLKTRYTAKTSADNDTTSTRAGYIQYSENNAYVWIKDVSGPVLTAPTAPQNFSATPGDGQVALSWTAPASDGGAAISRYEVSCDNGSTWITASTNTSYTFIGLTNGTEYTFKVRAVNIIGNGAEASATDTPVAAAIHTVNFYSYSSFYASKTVSSGTALGANWPGNPIRSGYSFGGWFTGQNGAGTQYTSATIITADVDLYAKWAYNGGGSSGGSSSTPTTPAYKAVVKAEAGTETTLPVSVDEDSGTASVDAGSQGLYQEGTDVTIPSIPDVETYSVAIPVPNLSTRDIQGTLTVNTDAGNVTIPSNMLTGVSGVSGSKAEIAIGQGDKDNLPDALKAAIGDRPLLQLSLSIDGKQTDWSNPDAPVTVSMPYTPTAAELANSESIVVWYIDGSGNVVSVPNGRYDPMTGMVTFTTTHFSDYAVAYNKVSFNDVAADVWYHKAVSFIASRGITGGTGSGNYSPEAELCRLFPDVRPEVIEK